MKLSLSNKTAALGIEMKQLKKLHSSPYLRCHMNACALKQRLRDRLQQRKFEIERIEHNHRKAINEQKLHKHISNALNRCEPAVLSLVSQYNSLCDNMKTYIKDGNAPHHAAQPVKISQQGLFSLDIDDEIWQDVGLEDDDDQGPQPPWLVDEEVREGIKHMLELDRCEEEKSRLQRERSAMQSWTRVQWEAIEHIDVHNSCHIINSYSGSPDVLYRLDIRARELTRLCALWQPEVEGIPPLYDNSPSWGPSVMQIAAARVAERQASQN
ncbi:hypothetical protein BU15DRAFT_52148 [Melanogaster broomeanus]|nr:hypothetical protein BU15DRAFT_52148 [Melanogaster broomeanus]